MSAGAAEPENGPTRGRGQWHAGGGCGCAHLIHGDVSERRQQLRGHPDEERHRRCEVVLQRVREEGEVDLVPPGEGGFGAPTRAAVSEQARHSAADRLWVWGRCDRVARGRHEEQRVWRAGGIVKLPTRRRHASYLSGSVPAPPPPLHPRWTLLMRRDPAPSPTPAPGSQTHPPGSLAHDDAATGVHARAQPARRHHAPSRVDRGACGPAAAAH